MIYQKKTQVILSAHLHQLIVRTWNGELRSGWGQREPRGAGRWDWGGWPSTQKLCVHRICLPPPRVSLHPDLLIEPNVLMEDFREGDSLSLSFWLRHRSACFYQLRPNVQQSTVRISCSGCPSVLYPVRWNHLTKMSPGLAKASVKCSWTMHV